MQGLGELLSKDQVRGEDSAEQNKASPLVNNKGSFGYMMDMPLSKEINK